MVETETLLEQAKKIDSGRHINFSEEEMELFIGWAKGEISTIQASKAIGLKKADGTFYYRAGLAFKQYIKEIT